MSALQYPVFIPSRGRVGIGMAMDVLEDSGVPYWLVVEPREAAAYRGAYGAERVKVLDANDRGLHYVRNWILDYTDKMGVERHWQVDDTVNGFFRGWGDGRRRVGAAEAMQVAEEFTGRYTNIAITGFLYYYWAFGSEPPPPVLLNRSAVGVYLMANGLGFRFRPNCFDDTDMGLQVLSSGWCTVRLTRYLFRKQRMGHMPGGCNSSLYLGGKQRLFAELARLWPGVAPADRAFRGWYKFKQQLIKKEEGG